MELIERGNVGRRRARMLPRFICSAVILVSTSASVLSCGEVRPLVVTPTTTVERTSAKGEASVAMEFTEVRVTLREDGTWQQAMTNRYKVLDRSALDSWGASQARYSPWYTKKPVIKAHVINVDGDGKERVHELEPSMLTEEPAYPQAPDVYGDTRVLRGPLPNVQVGSIIEETITTESHRTFLHPSYSHRGYFDSNVPVTKARFIVDAPEGMALNFKVFDAKVKRSEETKEGRTIVTFEGGPYPAYEGLEDSLPSDVVRWPNVAVAKVTDWKELSRTYEEVLDRALEGIDFKAAVSEIVSPTDEPRVKITKILQWVKDRIRYVGVEFGDSAIVPYAPDKTIARGFGDCKDQATLMVGLLRAAGLQAEVALLNAGRGEDISPELPAFNVFNHAIVHVSAPEDLYIDPTGDFFTVGNLPTSDQGRYVLLAGGPSAGLARTPEPDAARNTYEEVRTVRFKGTGAPDVHELSRGTGYFDAELRTAFSHPKERLSENLKDYVKNDYASESVSGIQHTNPLDLSAPFTGELVAEKAGSGSVDLLEAWADVTERTLFQWLPSSLLEGEEERKAPLFLSLPYNVKLVWKIAPPPGFVTSVPPADVNLDFGAAKLTRRVERQADDTLVVTSALSFEKARLSAAEVAKFRESYAEWAQGNVPRIVFKHAAWDLAQKGKLAEAVSLLNAKAKANAEAPLAKLRMSRILRPTLDEVALSQADEAIALAPKDVNVWREYAEVVASNSLGKDVGMGFPRAQAITAYTKVYELDSKQLYARLRHAVVLEHNEKGERYHAKKEDLLAAAAIYDSVPPKELREFENGTFRHNALYALFWARQYEEVDKRLKALPEEEAPKQLFVMTRAALDGADAAVALSEKLNMGAEERSTVLQATSAILIMRGDYVGGAKVLDAVRIEGEQARVLQRRASMLRSVARASEMAFSEDTPQALVTKLLALAITRDEEDHEFAKHYLAAGAQLQGKDSKLFKAVEKMRQELPTGVNERFLQDMMKSGNKLAVDGNKRVGYRVKATFEFGQGASTTTYVVEEGGRLKVRATGETIEELGGGAWEALQAGNQAQAEQWLNWAREGLTVSKEEDPLRVPPFGRLWNDGKGDAKTAAAVLAAWSDRAKTVLPYLENRVASARDDSEKQALLQAISYAYAYLEQHPQSLKAAQALYELVPGSKQARRMVFSGLWSTEDFAGYQKLVESSLRTATSDGERRELKDRQASVLARRGKIAESKQLRLQLIEESPSSSEHYNNAGWLGMFSKPTQQDVDHVLRGLELSRTSASLHTLSCLYAELGRIDDAAKTFVELRGMRKDGKLESIDWYIVGRIAEHLGFKDEAKRAYQKVEKPKTVSPTSTYALAERRLQKL